MKQSDKVQAEPYERPREKGFVNLVAVKRAKTTMLFLVAPLGLLAIVLAHRLNMSEKLNMGILWASAIAVSAYSLADDSHERWPFGDNPCR